MYLEVMAGGVGCVGFPEVVVPEGLYFFLSLSLLFSLVFSCFLCSYFVQLSEGAQSPQREAHVARSLCANSENDLKQQIRQSTAAAIAWRRKDGRAPAKARAPTWHEPA